MSDYQRERLLTYVGGPFLVLVGLLIAIMPFVIDRPDDVRYGMIVTAVFLAMVFAVFGISIFREGRRRLASNHWRAEHFQG